MKLLLKSLPELRGIYMVRGHPFRMPKRALKLHPDAATALLGLEAETGGLVYSDIYRSAEASLMARRRKRGVQPPGFSAHNYGLAVDLAIDDYVPPGTNGPKEQGVLSRLDCDYEKLRQYMAAYGWYCHRRDGKRGFEDWHFNFLGHAPGRHLDEAKRGWSRVAESVIQARYGSQLDINDVDLQKALAQLGMYHGEADGIIGPLSRSAVRAFERAWGLTEDGVPDDRMRRTLAFVSAQIEVI